jgi:hypothetical protein
MQSARLARNDPDIVTSFQETRNCFKYFVCGKKNGGIRGILSFFRPYETIPEEKTTEFYILKREWETIFETSSQDLPY